MRSPSLWRDARFLKLWAGQTVSEAGSRITMVGVPLAAAAVLHATPFEMGLIGALGGFATLAFGPVAGIVSDRSRLHPLMIGADLGRAAIIALIPIAAHYGWLTLGPMYAVIAISGALGVFFDVAYQSLLPRLLDGEQLLEANSKLAMSSALAEAIGPGLAGALIEALTAPIAMAVDALSFLVSALSLASMPDADETPRPTAHTHDWRNEVIAGFHFVWENRVLRALALRAVTTAFFWGFFQALYIYYAVTTLGFSPLVLGLVVTIGGISNFIGSAIIPWLTARMAPGTVLILTTMLAGISNILIPLPSSPGWFAVACLGAAQLIGDISFPIYFVEELTLRQRLSPADRLGRVNAAMQMLFRGILPIGALTGGALAGWVGVRTTLVTCSIGVLLATLWLVFSPIRSLRRESSPGLG